MPLYSSGAGGVWGGNGKIKTKIFKTSLTTVNKAGTSTMQKSGLLLSKVRLGKQVSVLGDNKHERKINE